MQTDILIIGQGICGTFLSWYLEQAGVSSIVIDEPKPYTASKAAAGIINPVTGRRIVKTWMIDELIPFVQDAYSRLGADLGQTFLEQQDIIDFFPTPQMRLAFMKRYEEDKQYLQWPQNEHTWDEYFRYDFGYGVISPCWLVDLPTLLLAWRKRLQNRQTILEERFDQTELIVEKADSSAIGLSATGPHIHVSATGTHTPGVRYKDIHARRVIFCDGVAGFTNPYFSLLPFAPNKGEALIIEIPDWPAGSKSAALPSPGNNLPSAQNTVFKKGITLAPWQNGCWWVGSSYEWSFDDGDPTEAFRKKTEFILQDWLKLPFRTVEHIAAVRPATLERRPFVGFHPRHPAIGILNGMGTKGCSLAPWFASQLVQNIKDGTPIQADADVRRFTGVLKRS
jgi:glycine/D-amino acid oxidase-like deaminating enzyme